MSDDLTHSHFDRRRSERRALPGMATLEFSGRPPVDVRTVEIGEGGMGVVAAVNPPPKLACVIRFQLPVQPHQRMSAEIECQVVHSIFSGAAGGFKIGLKFVGIDPELAQAVAKYASS